MGEHKHNQLAIDAKKGLISPRPPVMGKRQSEHWVYEQAERIMLSQLYGKLANYKQVPSKFQDCTKLAGEEKKA
jgi:hypothetical protein